MDVHPTKNGINRYWSIPILVGYTSHRIYLSWKGHHRCSPSFADIMWRPTDYVQISLNPSYIMLYLCLCCFLSLTMNTHQSSCQLQNRSLLCFAGSKVLTLSPNHEGILNGISKASSNNVASTGCANARESLLKYRKRSWSNTAMT